MPTPVSPPRLITDDYSGNWDEDMEDVFSLINKSGKELADSVASQVTLTNLGAQKIVLNSVVIPTLWTDATLAAGVTNFGGTDASGGYYKDAIGIVRLRGVVVRATVGTIFTLPTGYVPEFDCEFETSVDTAGTPQGARIAIFGSTNSPAGTVQILRNAPSTWGSLDCSFPCSDLSPGVPSCFPIKIVSKLPTGKASIVLLGTVVDQNKAGGALVRLGYNDVAWHNDTGFDGNNKQNYIVIDNIAGLLPEHTYTITLWALPDQ